MKIINKKTYFLAFLLVFSFVGNATDFYVDNDKGSDANNGSQERPFKTIIKSLEHMSGGDTLHFVPNSVPYRGGIRIENPKLNGTLTKPTIFDGHGAIISSLFHYSVDKWKDEGNDTFSVKLANNAWVMNRQGYWSGFPIVLMDGNPTVFVKAKKDLKAKTYFLYKSTKKNDPLQNILFIKLAPGQTPAQVKVEAPSPTERGGIYLACDYVTIRNLTAMYSRNDGFATVWKEGIVFENVRACFNMDQGISNHSSEVLVKNSRFDHNAGGGIVDVMMNKKSPCYVKYINCIIENDSFRGGVELRQGQFELENCIIRNNACKALEIANGAKVKLNNCILSSDNNTNGLYVDGSCDAEIINCTFSGFKHALRHNSSARVIALNNAFIKCKQVPHERKANQDKIGADIDAEMKVGPKNIAKER